MTQTFEAFSLPSADAVTETRYDWGINDGPVVEQDHQLLLRRDRGKKYRLSYATVREHADGTEPSVQCFGWLLTKAGERSGNRSYSDMLINRALDAFVLDLHYKAQGRTPPVEIELFDENGDILPKWERVASYVHPESDGTRATSFGAKIFTDGEVTVLHWTDFVANDWTEQAKSVAHAHRMLAELIDAVNEDRTAEWPTS